MTQNKQIKQVWWKEALRLQKIVATVVLVSFSAGLVHSDIDLDGIPDAVDPYPETVAQQPIIFTPTEAEVVYAPSREVTFTGTAEVGSQIKVFEKEVSTELSCQEANASDVQGTGLLVSKTTGGGSMDQAGLLTVGTIVDQAFYNTDNDSASTTWRTSETASWAIETRDDSIDGICDYQAGGAPEDRCGTAGFPQQVIVMATASRVYLFDAQRRTFWKSISVSGATSVAAENGKFFIGTSTGVLVWDFANDDFSKSFAGTLPAGGVVSLDTVAVGTTQYLLVATTSGVAVIDLDTDIVLTAIDSGTMVGAAFTSSNRILWATATEVQVSTEPVDILTANWTSTDVSSIARFPFSSPGTVTAVASDLIGLTTGVARVFDDGDGKLLVQHVTRDSATLPMGLSTRGHWLDANASLATDVSTAGKNLDNVLTVTSIPADTGTDLDIFEFGGAERYLKSQTPTDFSVSGKNITVGAWVRRPNYGGTGPFQKIMTHGDGGAAGDWDYWLSAGENFFDYGLNADPYFFGLRTQDGEKGASAFTFALDTWQLLVGTYDADAGELRMYLDGEEQDQSLFLPGVNPVPLTGDIDSVDKELRLGWGYDQEYFDGDMALPFVAAETYSAEQVALLHRFSNDWFTENKTTTLRGVSDSVTDVTCDDAHKECFVLTSDGIVTKIDGNIFSGGTTTEVVGVTNVSAITPTYLGTWQCTHAFDTSGAYTVSARTYWEGEPTAIESGERSFTVFAQSEQTLDQPVILAFPEEFISQKNATVLWTTDDTDEDYFVAQMATDVGFQIGVRQQLAQGHSARFDVLDDSQQYYFRVKSQNHLGGASEWSDTVTVTVDASAPDLGEVVNTAGRISLELSVPFSWELTPFSDIGSGILWYEVEVSSDQSFVDDAQQVFADDRFISTQKTITGEQGKTYFARVRAMDGVGNWSSWAFSSGTLLDTTAPEVFSLGSLPSSTAGTEMALRWTTAVDAETGIVDYEVWKKEGTGTYELLSTENAESRFYNATGLADGETYTFKIIAKNGAALLTETEEQTISINASYAGAPQWLSSSYSTSTSVSLDWTADSDVVGATEYQIFRGGTLLDTISIGITAFTDPDTHLNSEVKEYTVRAFLPAPDAESVDIAGEYSPVLRVLIDTVEPLFDSYEILGPSDSNGWRNGNFSLRLWGTDGIKTFDPDSSSGTGFSSGVDTTIYRAGSTGDFTSHHFPILITESGSYDYEFKFRDRAGYLTSVMPLSNVNLDSVAPTAVISQTNVTVGDFETQNGFLSADILQFQIIGQDDGSGVDSYEISYRVDKNGDGFFRTADGDTEWSAWAPSSATGNISVPSDGLLEMRAAVTDLAGNRTISETTIVKIDRSAPILSSDTPTSPIAAVTTVQLQASDGLAVSSGFSTMYYTKSGADPKASLFPIRREGTTVSVDPATDAVAGIFSIKYYATDAVGNESDVFVATNLETDTDADGLPDWWEALYGGAVDPTSDTDTDGLTAEQEFASDTNPTVTDTDGDSVSDGDEKTVATNPLDATDHKFLWVAPASVATVSDTFTIIGTATPGAIVEIEDVTTTTSLGIATVDPQGRFAMEVENLTAGTHELQASFQHPENLLAVIESDLQSITVDVAGTPQPQISNLFDGDQIGPSTTRVLVSNVTAEATVELFEIIDNVLYSLGTTVASATGTADLWLPRRSEARRLFVLDHDSWKTSEIVSIEQGLFIEGRILDEGSDPIESATIELTDSQDSSTTVQTEEDGTYQIFARPGQTYVYRVEAAGFTAHEQGVTTAFDDVRVNVELLFTDLHVNVTGTVSDSEGTLLEGATVTLIAGAINESTTTTENGTFTVNVPASTVYTATFALVDHDTHTQSVEVLREDVALNNVTLVAQELAVVVSGQVLSAETGQSVLGATATFVSSDASQFETQSGESGEFSLSVRRDRDYTATFVATGYKDLEKTFSVGQDSLVLIDIKMIPLEGPLPAAKQGWSGRVLGDQADSISDTWIPSMTYEESLAQVERLNSGIAGQVKTREKDGTEFFAGYISGRISVDQFLRADDSKILGMSSFSDRVKELHASAKLGHCLSYHDTTMDFRDVPVRSRAYPSIAKMYSLGQMPLDEERKFRPTEVMNWDTALELIFAIACSQPDAFELLQSFNLEQWENAPLQNTIESRRAYTALDAGLITVETDVTKSPTREEWLMLLVKAFAVPIDERATQSSFNDVPIEDDLSSVLVAVRKFDLIPQSKNFRPESVLPRSEAAQWFISFYDAEEAGGIDRTLIEDQFDDLKVATGREVTMNEQIRGAFLQKQVAEQRLQRITDTAPVPSDLDTAGRSGFIRRQGESREDFLKRLNEAKQSVDAESKTAILDYKTLREESLAHRGVVEKEVESKIQVTDTSGFIRRQGESREDFLRRLAVAKQELEEKKIAQKGEVMRASAPKLAGPTLPTQNVGKLKIELDTNRMCNVKMSWETSDMFHERCGDIRDEDKETAYQKMFQSLKKRPGFYQQTVEPTEVTVEPSSPLKDTPVIKRSRMDVALRRVESETEIEEKTAKVKTRRSQLGL